MFDDVDAEAALRVYFRRCAWRFESRFIGLRAVIYARPDADDARGMQESGA